MAAVRRPFPAALLPAGGSGVSGARRSGLRVAATRRPFASTWLRAGAQGLQVSDGGQPRAGGHPGVAGGWVVLRPRRRGPTSGRPRPFLLGAGSAPCGLGVAGPLVGPGVERWKVGGALVARPSVVFVRTCDCGIVVVPLAEVVRWIPDNTMVARLVEPAIFTARRRRCG